MPRLKSPTIKPVVCTRCGQARGTLKKISKDRYIHFYSCPKPLPKPTKIILPTVEQVVAVEQTKEQ